MATRIREKAEQRAREKDNRPYAVAKYVRMSPSKVRIVLDTVRGKSVVDAAAILKAGTTAASEACAKLLNSAIANAENNKGLSRQDLILEEAWVGAGPTMKRLDIRARGRANRILKRSSHITMILGSVEN